MISVIIPCFNAQEFLEQALNSVFSQSRPAFEVIVVDDGSRDRSADVAAKYPVKLLRTAGNFGHAAARNLGIEQARGELIAWLDADDYFEPRHLEVVAGLLEGAPDAVAAYSAVRRVGDRDGVWYVRAEDFAGDELFWRCFGSTIIPAMSAITRTEAVRGIGGFNTKRRVAPDFGFWLNMLRLGTFVSSPQVTSNYRWHSSQISNLPLRQLESIYATRSEWMTDFCASGDVPSISRATALIRESWDLHLSQAWASGERSQVSAALQLRRYVPGEETRLGKKLRRRMRLPGWPGGVWPALRSLKSRTYRTRSVQVSQANPS